VVSWPRPRPGGQPLGGALKGRAIERLRKLNEGIWTLQGDPVRFFTFPYELRSTIVDLGSKLLFVHSPVQLSVAAEAVESLGRSATSSLPTRCIICSLESGEPHSQTPGSTHLSVLRIRSADPGWRLGVRWPSRVPSEFSAAAVSAINTSLQPGRLRAHCVPKWARSCGLVRLLAAS
jgi:hypothetical protein